MNLVNSSQQNFKQNKMFCSLVAWVVNLACLIGIARCSKHSSVLQNWSSCITDVKWFLRMSIFWDIYLQFVKYYGTQVWRTCHHCPILHYTSHSVPLWDLRLIPHLMLVPPPDLGSLRSVSQTDATWDLCVVMIMNLCLLSCLCQDDSCIYIDEI